jgi:hypothetical protein
MSKMKNFMDFKTFSVSESYYNEFSYLKDEERSSELGKKLERVRGRVKDQFRSEDSYGEKPWRSSKKDAINWLAGEAISGVLGLGAAAADLFGKSREDKKKLKDEDPDKAFSPWREDLGSTATEKDLEKFVKKSEETAFKRYGKSWDYNNPKGAEQKKFADMIKKGESEIVSRMKK